MHFVYGTLGIVGLAAILRFFFSEVRDSLVHGGTDTENDGIGPVIPGCFLLVLGPMVMVGLVPLFGGFRWVFLAVPPALAASFVLVRSCARRWGARRAWALRQARSNDPYHRTLALEKLGRHGNDKVIREILFRGLRDPVDGVKKAAAVALQRLGAASAAVEGLGAALQETPYRSSDLVEALVATGPACEDFLVRMVDEGKGTPVGLGAAVEVLGRIGGPRVDDLLVRWLCDPVPPVRAAAAGALGDRRSEKAVPALADRLEDPEYDVRISAVSALIDIGTPAALKPLRRAVRDEIEWVREQAIGGLSGGDPDGSADVLVAALADPKPQVRVAAVKAVTALGPEQASGPLRGLLQDPEPALRSAAASALGSLGDKESVPLLVPLLMTDSLHGVRAAAAQALQALGWHPETSQQEILDAVARGEWAAARQPAAVAPLLLAVRDEPSAAGALGALEELLRTSGGFVSSADLKALAALDGVFGPPPPRDMAPTPLDCGQVRTLASKELTRRGL